MHEGLPFKGQGKVLEHMPGVYINAISISHEANLVFVVTSDKQIIVLDAETGEKQAVQAGAHSKGIYDVAVYQTTEDSVNLATCSADSRLKLWTYEKTAKTFTEKANFAQIEGVKEDVNR